MASHPIRLGIVGVGGRGDSFASLLDALPAGTFTVSALCDVNRGALDDAAPRFPDAAAFTEFDALLGSGLVDAVLVATPMPLHAPMSAAALGRGIHVLCEVPAAISEAQARGLVRAARASRARYAMAENYLFSTANRMIRAIAAAGLFGRVTWGRGEYIHELKELNERTPWRRQWQTGIRGITYPTHSLGPLLDWCGERVIRLTCAGTGSHYRDPAGASYHDDSATMLGHLAGGGLVEIRVDMISDRPHEMQRYELQGTDGACEVRDSMRRIWLRALDPEPRWRPLDEAYGELAATGRVPPLEPVPEGVGHGGGDYFVLKHFAALLREPATGPASSAGTGLPDVHRALDMTLPGLVSQRAILDGSWRTVPDSRGWFGDQEQGPVVTMIYPESAEPPEIDLPAGYSLETLRDEERPEYVALMQSAGFVDWTMERFGWVERAVLPGGHFVVRHEASGAIVATALAAHRPDEDFPYGGELGWVATLPEHGGRGLARAACVAVLRRFRSAGYESIYLLTNTWRLAAVALYLKLGFVPYLRSPDHREAWERTLPRVGWGQELACCGREGIDLQPLRPRSESEDRQQGA